MKSKIRMLIMLTAILMMTICPTVTNAEDVYIGSSRTDGSAYYIRTETVKYEAGNACRAAVIDTRYGGSKIINYTFFKSHRNLKYYAYKTDGNSQNYFPVNEQEDTMFACAFLRQHNALP